jgi:hypothetical protein
MKSRLQLRRIRALTRQLTTDKAFRIGVAMRKALSVVSNSIVAPPALPRLKKVLPWLRAI